MRKKLLFFVIMLCFLSGYVSAQREVRGIVSSSTDGTKLAGVNIAGGGSNEGAVTGDDGSYNINVADNVEELTFSFVGFESRTLKVPQNGTLDVELEEDPRALNEVVITAGGLTAQRRQLGNQATTIKSREVTQGKSSNIAAGLSGKVPGLLVSSVSSGVNPSYRLVLRGNRSLRGNNQALLIIDNVITPNSMLGNLNPQDLEDVQILNGAGAAALYGSDASNGALIITTKKGAAGTTEVKLSHTTTFEKVSFLPKIQNGFGSGTTPDEVPSYTPYENQQYGPAFDGSIVEIGKPLENDSIQRIPYSPTNSRDEFWRLGAANQTDFSISSGDAKSTYYVSGQYFDQKSSIPFENYKRYSIRANTLRKITDKVTALFNVNVIANRYNQSNQNGAAYTNLLMSPAQVDVSKYENWRTDPFANPNGYFNEYFANPYFTLGNNRQLTKNSYVQGTMELKWRPINDLTLTYRLGGTLESTTNKSYANRFIFTDYTKSISGSSKIDVVGSVNDANTSTIQIINDFFGEYRKELSADFSLSAVLGVTFRENNRKGVNVGITGLVVDSLFNVSNNLNPPTATESNFRATQIGVYGDIRLGFRDFLYLHATGRNDWRSILSKENRSFFYPSVDFSFIASDAIPALKSAGWLSSLKLRGGYSQVGQISLGDFSSFGAYELLATFSQTNGYPYGSGAGMSLGNTLVSPSLKPEMTKGFEGGLDIEIAPYSLQLGLTAYQTNTVDQTIPIQIASSTGFSSLVTNVGSVQNKGIEANFNVTPIQLANGFEWSVGGNFTLNRNKVLELADSADLILSTSGSAARILAKVGEPFPLLQVTQYNRDDMGRIIVDKNTGYPTSDGAFYNAGVTVPPYVLGLNTQITFKGIRFAAVFEYRGGHYIYNALSTQFDFSGAGLRTAWYNRDRFVIPNSSYLEGETYVENTNIAVRSGGADFWTDGTRNTGIGENYTNSASFWKMREATISYDLPASLLARTKFIKAASVSIQGRNLFIWVPKTNLYSDPEYSANGSGSNAVGFITNTLTPPVRYFGGTISLTF